MSIDLVPLWAADWTESDKHIKLIGLMTITMKKNNSDQTKCELVEIDQSITYSI